MGTSSAALATLLAMSFILVVAGLILLGVRHHREQQRLANVRSEVVILMAEGQQAFDALKMLSRPRKNSSRP